MRSELIPNGVRLNQLSATFYYDAIDAKYDLYQLSTSERYISWTSKVLDMQVFDQRILAVSHGQTMGGQRALYLLLQAGACAEEVVREAVAALDSDIAVSVVSSRGLTDVSLLRLLANAVYAELTCPFYNNSGRLLRYVRSESASSGKDTPMSPDVIVTCEIYIDRNLRVVLPVRTFSSKNVESSIIFRGGKNWDSYPHYIYNPDSMQMLRTYESVPRQMEYIHRVPWHDKHLVDYLCMTKMREFEFSKIGILNEFVGAFNICYQGLAQISFVNSPEARKYYLPSTHQAKLDEFDRLERGFEKATIVDLVQTDVSQAIAEELRREFEHRGIPVVFSDMICADGANVVIIHDRDYYRKAADKDQHAVSAGCVVQNVTVETYEPLLRKGQKRRELSAEEATKPKRRKGDQKVSALHAVFNAVYYNLLIKRDIVNGRIEAADLSGFDRTGDWRFGICEKVRTDDGAVCDLYGLMMLHSDDHMEMMFYKGLDVVMADRCYQPLTRRLVVASDADDPVRDDLQQAVADERAVCVIQDENGHVVTLENTDLYTVPQMERIHEILDYLPEIDQEQMPRGYAHSILQGTPYQVDNPRVELFGELYDINCYADGDDLYYWVDDPSNGRQNTLGRAEHIRCITGENAVQIGERLMPTFSNVIIRNGVPSVLPFAVKYLREGLRMQFPEVYSCEIPADADSSQTRV